MASLHHAGRSRLARTLIGLSALSGGAVMADVIHATNDPFGSFLGINGFDVFERQSVAARFEPTGDYTLDRVSLWLWNNDESGVEPAMVITLRTDNNANGESRPSNVILETWNFVLPNTGAFQPNLFAFDSASHPSVAAGARYWVVAESDAAPGADPVWAWAANEAGWGSTVDPTSGKDWYDASHGAVCAMIVEGTPDGGILGDVDGDGDVDLNDLTALLSSFGLCDGDPLFNPATDFDGSGCTDLSDLTTLLSNYGL